MKTLLRRSQVKPHFCHSRKRSAPACPVGRSGILLKKDSGQAGMTKWRMNVDLSLIFLVRLLNIRHLVAVLSLALLCSFPKVSWGHAFPDHSDPKVGSTMAASPARVRIWFDSDLEPAFSTITVHNSNNEMVDKRDGRVDSTNPTLLQVSLPKLPPGLYRVMWNVVSRDGHRTTGDFTFTIR